MFAPISYAGPQSFNDWFVPDTTQRYQLGLIVDAVDPYWGGGIFVYGASLSTMEKGSLVQMDEVHVFADLPSTTLMGRPFGVLMNSMITGQFGWAQLVGMVVVSAASDVAKDAAAAVAAAGQAGATATGKQLLGYRSLRANAATVAKTNT